MSTSLVQNKVITTVSELSEKMIDRDGEILSAMAALFSNNHALFVGPPGTAKTMIVEIICKWIKGEYFYILLGKYTSPEEAFGPYSINGLKEDVYRRVSKGYLPDAHVAVLDEIFKASSSINNTFLPVLNERRYRNGTEIVDCNLQAAFAASNEWPVEAEELGALFDRFLIRQEVEAVVDPEGLDALMFSDDLTPELSTTLSLEELNLGREEVKKIDWNKTAIDAMREIRSKILDAGIMIGNRRIRQSTVAVQAFAYVSGASKVSTDHLEILNHIWWADPTEDPKKVADIVRKVAKPTRLRIVGHVKELKEIRSGAQTNMKEIPTAIRKTQEIKVALEGYKNSPFKDRAIKICDESLIDLGEKFLAAT